MSLLNAAVGGAGLGTLYVQLTADASRLIAGMNQAEQKMVGSTAIIVKQATLMATGVTAAFVAIGAAGVYQFGKFEEQMIKATSIMGEVSASMRKELQDTARQMSRNSVTSAEKLAEAYFFLISAGLDAAQAQQALGAVNSFAIAGAMDLATATTLAVGAQSALGMRSADAAENLKQLQHVTDVLAKANVLAIGSIQDFSEALTNRAAAALHLVGKDIEEGVAALAVYSDRNIKGAHAGEQLAIVLRDLQRVAIESKEGITKLGISVYDSKGKMQPLVTILRSMEKAFEGMADEQLRATFLQLGFQDRSLSSLLSLLGTADAMEEYEKKLRSANGMTEEISKKMQEGINAQFTILKNNVVDLFIGFGEKLTPALKVFNAMLKEAVQTQGQFTEVTSDWLNFSGVLVKVVGTIGDVFSGWSMILKTVEIGINTVGMVITGSWTLALKGISKLMETVVNGWVSGINMIIVMANKLLPEAHKLSEIKFRLDIDTSTVENYFEAFKQGAIESKKELEAMVDKGTFGDRLKAEWEKSTKAAKEETKKQVAIVEEAEAHILAYKTEMKKREQAMKWQAEQDLAAREKEILDMKRMGKGEFMENLSFQSSETRQLRQLAEMQKQSEEKLAILRKYNAQDENLSEKAAKKKLEMLEEYGAQEKILVLAQAAVVMASATKAADDMANIAGMLAGKQSGAYKAMFAMSKSFAIAQATVQIALGIATAASAQPWFMAIPAMASIIAATSSIVSSIQSTQLVLNGEAKAMGGPVSAGKQYLVGEKGPELFSPASNGHITPNNRLGMGDGGGVRVSVNNYTDATAKVTERNEGGERVIEVMVARVKNEISSEVREGRGAINKSLEATFNLRRGQR